MQSDPIGWFTRSNFGGRFATMLKHAGWDGIVIEGTADEPVWLDIRDKKVVLRAAGQWGRQAADLQSGDLPYAHWGIPMHYDPRTELEWGYGTILGDRDVNEHDFANVWDRATLDDWMGRPFQVSAEEAVNAVLPKLVPFQDDPRILAEYYRLEGWAESTGYPTRQTLETLGLVDQIAMLDKHGKLG